METTVKAIDLKDFDLLGHLDDEQDALDSFMSDYSGSTYLCDAISEISDSFIPIYNSDVWKNASDISDYIEDAISEGLAPTDGRDIDLIKIFQSGYYVYYQRSLYDNLSTMVYNMIATKTNEAVGALNRETQEAIDYEALEEAIESASENIDNNDRFETIDEEVEALIERIHVGEFAIDEE